MDLNKELEIALGLRSGEFKTYKTLRVDNGDDKKGTNKTGEFVCKTKDEQGAFVREQFSKVLKGVVVLTRAKVSSKFKKDVEWWISAEFNPSNQNETIQVFKKKNIVWTGNYKSLKAMFSIKEADGTTTNNFNYRSVLYVALGEDIVKLELMGKSQSEWFQYSNLVNVDSSLLGFETICEIKEDPENDTYYASFSKGEKVDYVANLGKAKDILGSFRSAPQLEAPKETKALGGGYEDEEINIEDVPF
ncbi:MAG: hypothetical protein WCI36_02950 [bacterium]